MLHRGPAEGLIDFFMRIVDNTFATYNVIPFPKEKPTMAQSNSPDIYVPSTFQINRFAIHLGERHIAIEYDSLSIHRAVEITPRDRDEAIRLSIVLRKAARRLEAIGNTVLGEVR